MTKELRIGNLLLHEGEVKEVNEIGTKKVNEGVCGYVGFKSSRTMSWLEHKGSWLVNPIPLTEEWLVKFGFEYNRDDDLFVKESLDGDVLLMETLADSWCASVPHLQFVLSIEHKEDFSKVAESSVSTTMLNNNGGFETVHQLQNLYFALTGEELTIKN